ncbi:hypothetical protein ACHAXS_013126 [Conticribra weissflogii]
MAGSLVRGLREAKLNDRAVYNAFVAVAREEGGTSVLVFPAVALASSILTSSLENCNTIRNEDKENLINLFLKASTASTPFPHPTHVSLAAPFLSSHHIIDQAAFDEKLAPALGLKLRAHPESVLPFLEVILACLTNNGHIDGSQHMVDGGDGTRTNLLSSMMKHLKSAKLEMRWLAWKTLVLLAKLSYSEGDSLTLESATLVTNALCEALTATTGSTALTTSDYRSGAYAALEGIAIHIANKLPGVNGKSEISSPHFAERDTPMVATLADKALSTLVGSIVKDKAAPAIFAGDAPEAPFSLVAKEVGYTAIISWMWLSKRIMQTDGKSGYDAALNYLAEPVNKYSAKDGEFRFRIGSLVIPPMSVYLSSLCSNATFENVGRDTVASPFSFGEVFAESIIVDLIKKKNLTKGLEAVVDAAVKKHSTSEVVAQIDGALAVFLVVLNAHSSLTSSTPLSISPSVKKVVAAGATSKGHESSFLFSPSMMEAARSEVLVNYVLHRVIALYCKIASKSIGDNNARINDDKPLVRVIEKKTEESSSLTASNVSTATKALAVCTANTVSIATQPSSSYSTIHSSLKTITTYSPASAKAADAIITTFFLHVNEQSLKFENAIVALKEDRSSRDQSDPIEETFNKLPAIKGKPSVYAPSKGYDPNSIRLATKSILPMATAADTLWRALLLSHIGTTALTNRRQRVTLVSYTLDVLKDMLLPFAGKSEKSLDELTDEFAQFLARFAASTRFDPLSKSKDPNNADGACDAPLDNARDEVISPALHEISLSLVTTLGGIAGSFDTESDNREDEGNKPYSFAHKLCIEKMPPHLISHLSDSMERVESITDEDVALYQSPKGILFRTEGNGASSPESKAPATTKPVEKKKAAARKGKGGGFDSFADEEWERQVKKDLEKKKKEMEKTASGAGSLSPQEKELLNQQTQRQEELSRVLCGDLPRALATIRILCESDIEVGNACLPVFGMAVVGTVVNSCSAMMLPDLQNDAFDTLTTLASCVYEIEETHAPTLARALAISFQSNDENTIRGEEDSDNKKVLTVSALPSPCAPAACAIFEMDDYGECLSGTSFAFLFPIIKAALTGQRNIPGCDAALSVLARHCAMLAGEEMDANVKSLRKEMVTTVLELLSHDRSQTFVNPTPYETLISCYTTDEAGTSSGPALTAPEIAPLLGGFGALGNENTRVASMETLASIAEKHPKLVKNNPLVENRIWLNCFDKNDRIKHAARKAWLVANGNDTNVNAVETPLHPPSKMYAVPLLPLLSHDDASIASAAAAAMAHAMGMHPDSTEKNIIKLCNTYISSFPAMVEEDRSKQPSIFPEAPAPAPKKPVKKVIDTGLKKKPTTKKISSVSSSMAKITGAPAPKKIAATKKLLAKTAPVKERTLDQEALMGQFKTSSAAKKENIEADSNSKIATRMGVLLAISSLTDSSAQVILDLPVLKIVIGFLMAFGLGDGNEGVRSASRNASRDIVAKFGSSEEAIAFLLPLLESVLKTGQADESSLGSISPEKVPRSIATTDLRKEGVVVSLGSIALYLKDDTDAEKIDGIIDMLLNALNTPSEDVQSSVALALSKLMKKGRTQQRIETLLNNLMTECIHGKSLASRRGAAYGISAVVKGSGIASLKKYDVVKRLEESCTSGSPSSKEGALFAIELLSSRLGILFEPYVIVLLPALLKAFSDNNDYVRTAAEKTVGLIMSNLSGHGVKLVMPAVLEAFNEPEWRTKQASIHMLGSMSHCAPKQLASCLPKVVPKLTEAFSDTHPKVKSSAEEALEEICKVIKNPEISSISSTLLSALTDPANATLRALEALISTEFLHAIDAPSLSIIIPVVHRGLRDRAATTKRYAALISGNICTMVNDPRDFVPYLPVLLPDLKSTLLDPIPDVRSISAKSLGSLTRGLGEATFPDLRPWLVETLTSDAAGSVERSGAAQGLTEILVAGGAHLTENVMSKEILPLKSHPKAGTREGVLWVLTFLPSALGHAYSSLIDASLPALLSGLADDNEVVREVALRAGRVLVKSHGKAHKDKILPSLEDGLRNEDYRIRVASLTLLGDLLSMLGGTKVAKGNADTQDDIRQAERAQAQIALVLGNETRKRVLSSLYLCRSDTAAIVRQSAVQVWKTVVSVTPRTLREILSELVDQIVSALASGDPERTQVAGRCLGDIVQKLGDQVLPEIIPVLRDSLYRGDEHTRQGVCVGLAEVISCSSKEQITKFLDIIVKVVQDALCDDNEQVRKMASSCFQSLYQVVGARTLDEVVPALLVGMESTSETAKARALNGMTGILSVRSRELLPYIIPRLLKSPLTISHADALASISAVTSESIYMHFNTIIPTLITEIACFSECDNSNEEKEREDATRRCSRAVCHNVDTAGVNWLISEVASKCTSDKESIRKEGCWFLQIVIEERANQADFYEQVPIIIRELLQRLNDSSQEVLKSTNLALNALTKFVPAEELVIHIGFIRNLIASMVSDARYRKGGVGDGEFLLPGLNQPKGLEPLLPIYQRGILYGDATVRETSAAGLGELIKITSNKYLAGPFLIKLTGPLLRIVGDRNPSAVKIAIVQTLGLILTKGGPALRAFVPQFQTTFVKALSDPSRMVRIEAIKALALLMPLSTRVDPLIKELVASSLGKSSNVSVETAGLVAIQTATLEALAVVLRHGGKKVKLPESIPSSLDAGKELVVHEDDGIRESAAKVIGYACELLGADEANEVVQEFVVDKMPTLSSSSSEVKHGIACICRRVLTTSIGEEIDGNIYESISSIIQTLMKDDKSMVREAAFVAIGAVLGCSADAPSALSRLERNIAKGMDSKEEIEVQKAVAKGLCITARKQPGLFRTQEGLFLINNALKLAMSGAQRVQFAYNDFLWLALDVENGESGLDEYLNLAHFEQAKTMKAIYSKVLIKIKSVDDSD